MTGVNPAVSIDEDPDVQMARNTDLSETERNIFDWDPYTDEPLPEEGEPKAAEEKQSAPTANPEEKPEGQSAEAPAGEPASQTPPSANPELEQLRQELARIQEQNQALLSALQTKQEAKPEQPAEAPKPKRPEPHEIYNYANIPEPLLQQIRSEDPKEFRAGISSLAAGISATVHTILRKEMEDRFQEEVQPLTQRLPTIVSAQMSEAQQAATIKADFYGNHTYLNDPAYYRSVHSIAQVVMEQKQSKAWTKDVREETAKRVCAMHGIPYVPAKDFQPPAPAGKPPTLMPTSGARGTPGRRAKTPAEQIAELMPDD